MYEVIIFFLQLADWLELELIFLTLKTTCPN